MVELHWGEPQKNIYKICGLRSLRGPSDLAVPTIRGLALRQSLFMVKISCFSKRGKHYCNIKGLQFLWELAGNRPSVGLTAWS